MQESSVELRRAGVQCNVAKLHPRRGVSKIDEYLTKIDALLSPIVLYSDDVERRIKTYLEECDKHAPGLGITETERITILKAMGSVSGHWYKCPNGHVYYIGDCGGATQQSRCNECGVAIGGANHRLVGDNDHAPEMDGSARAAWPPH